MLVGSKVPVSQVNTSSSYRLSRVLLRISLMTNVVMLFAVLGSLGAVWFILPMKTVHPVLVRLGESSQQIVDLEVLRPSRESDGVYREALSRQFVVDRETITLVEDRERLGNLMNTFMSEEVSEDFARRMTLDNPDSPLKHATEKKIQKTVFIEASRPHPTCEDCIEVEWRADFIHQPTSKLLERKTFRTLVRSEFNPRTMTKQQSLANPFGLEIVSYATEEKE